MNKKIKIVISIVVATIVIPFGIYTISPLFTSNTVNEPLPTTAAGINKNAALQDYQKFVSMNDLDRSNAAKQMSQRDKNIVMIGASQINNAINEIAITTETIKQRQQQRQQINNAINESAITTETIKQRQQQRQQNDTTTARNIMTGSFIGAGDGFHNAEGLTRVIQLGDGSKILRLENFKSTNGPNVHLYLATDKTASNIIDLGRLKANNGNQNYNIPRETDLTKYNMVLIWCKDFSVLFGSAQLRA
jgi:hypothetical protein